MSSREADGDSIPRETSLSRPSSAPAGICVAANVKTMQNSLGPCARHVVGTPPAGRVQGRRPASGGEAPPRPARPAPPHHSPPGAAGASPRRALASARAWSPILSGAGRCLLGHCHPPGSLGQGAPLGLVFLCSRGKSGFDRSREQRPGRGRASWCLVLPSPRMSRLRSFLCWPQEAVVSPVHVSVVVGDVFVKRAVTASLTCPCCTELPGGRCPDWPTFESRAWQRRT